VVGMVGAGGIGVILHEAIRGFDYAETSAVLVIIIVSVTLIDVVSARVRRWTI
jgi:phosphonate transport system permease protein